MKTNNTTYLDWLWLNTIVAMFYLVAIIFIFAFVVPYEKIWEWIKKHLFKKKYEKYEEME